VVFAVGGITDRGGAATCAQDRKTLETAVSAYFAQHGGYPTALTDLQVGHAYLAPDPNITATGKVVNGYMLTYNPATGDVSACQPTAPALAPTPITVLGCSPSPLGPGPQQEVTISGTGFNPADADVSIPGLSSIHVLSRTTTSIKIKVTVPGAANGPQTVTVTSAADSLSGAKVGCFQVT
jgi:hypothetical protein